MRSARTPGDADAMTDVRLSSGGERQGRLARGGVVRLACLLPAVGSTAYAFAGLFWMAGGGGFPFGTAHDPLARRQSILENVTQESAAPWVVALGLLGTVIALAMCQVRRRGPLASLLLVLAGVQGATYAFVIPDGRPLIAAAHIPILLAGKPFGWPPGVTISSQVSWPVANQLLLILLGASWFAAAVVFHRTVARACQVCGRHDASPAWTRPERAARWGRWAVAAAIAVPALYAMTRLAWALGIPLGVSRRFLTEEAADSPEIFIAGAFMAMLALGGATLTLGLVQKWGEVYPRWIPWLRGNPVRPRTAIVPATVVAFIIIGPGVGWIRTALLGYFPPGALSEDWGTVAPGALWPVWGVGLALATYAYYLRRRGRCRACRRS